MSGRRTKPYVTEPLTNATESVTLVDLFAGIGGFHYGVGAAAARLNRGVRPLLVSEIEKSCADVYAQNHPTSADVMRGDIKAVKLNDFSGLEADFVTAGFPCQPFSNSGRKLGLKDPRGQFYSRIEQMIQHFRAKVFILENVPGMTKNGGGSFQSQLALNPQTVGRTMHVLEKRMLSGLTEYHIRWLRVDSSDLGSPQVRRRVYIVGLHRDLGPMPDLFLKRTAPSVFADLAEGVEIHGTELNRNQETNIRMTMRQAGSPSYKDGMRRVGRAYLCDGGNVGQAYHAFGMVPTLTKVWARFLPIYFPHPSEAVPDRKTVAFTPTRGLYGKGHLRRASVREAMLLQGFPPSFIPHEQDSRAYEHAGNAVNAVVVRELASRFIPLL